MTCADWGYRPTGQRRVTVCHYPTHPRINDLTEWAAGHRHTYLHTSHHPRRRRCRSRIHNPPPHPATPPRCITSAGVVIERTRDWLTLCVRPRLSSHPLPSLLPPIPTPWLGPDILCLRGCVCWVLPICLPLTYLKWPKHKRRGHQM